ncbi:ferrochelatase [Luteimonas sp. FXH3W]|uniref:Ferrochelatase n=1 Tax=Aquilutibacter rugosus TaxID=3115820 RepID=A0ABU7UX62_9GAMM
MNSYIAPAAGKPHVLLVNLGTPDAPTPTAVRRYLRQFLSDERVVDLPRWKWLPILNLVILPLRSGPVSRKYREIWTAQGSPLAVETAALAARLGELRPDWEVAAAMRYGNPDMAATLRAWVAAGVKDVRVLPLYPQYSITTVASVQDVVDAVAPGANVVPPYFAHPAWLDAVADSIRRSWEQHGRGEHLLFSFHGIPQRLADAGDPYPEQNAFAAAEIARRLGLTLEDWTLTHQSRFGREPWLLPDTQSTAVQLTLEGTRTIDIVTPGFAVDCLETLEELQIGVAAKVQAAGGRARVIPCLNGAPEHAAALANWVDRHA